MSSFTVSVYQRTYGDVVRFTTLGLDGFTHAVSGRGIRKAEAQLIVDLKKAVVAAKSRELVSFVMRRGTSLERIRVELTLKDARRRKVSGLCPIIVEPRDVGGGRQIHLAYHPARQGEWFPAPPGEDLREAAAAYFATTWAALPDDEIATLFTDGKDSLRVVSFDARTRTLLDELPDRKPGIWDDLEVDPARKAQKREMRVLPRIGVDVTAELAGAEERDLGLPRPPYREELQALLGGARKRATIVVGPPGCGKSTLISRLVADVVRLDGYGAHKNLDKVTRFYRISGRHLIAGMSKVGEWEQRCVDLAGDLHGRNIVLLVTDLHLFARIGRARDSDRALSDFFRAPVARGEIVMVGECTPAMLRRLEDLDPTFASAFVPVHVQAATPAETLRMMLARARRIEAEKPVVIEPMAYQTILELGGALDASRALPGKAVDLLVRVAESAATPEPGRVRAPGAEGAAGAERRIGSHEVIEHISRDTGLSWLLLASDTPFTADEVARDLGAQVFGQPAAVREAADLVVRIKAGLTDPQKPYGVYLFTGPTGTGKTELAKALAAYLYGSASRLVRFDMSELSGPDAVSRLVGDAWEPEGALVRAGIAEPFSVVLLDEIEKAHPAVQNLLLQLFDEGRLTDAAGNTADFTRAVLIMTSNLGARHRAPVGFDEAPEGRMQEIARAVREFFSPELFNRIDAVVPFEPLSAEVSQFVADKELGKLLARPGLADRDVFVQVGEGVTRRVAEHARFAEDGARSLKKYLEEHVGSLLVTHIARAPAALSVVNIDVSLAGSPDELTVETHALVEAQPAPSRFALLELWEESLAELEVRLPGVMASLDRIAESDGVARLSDLLCHHLGEHNRGRRQDGELLYNVDWMRGAVEDVRQRVEALLVASRDVAHATFERALDPHGQGRERVEMGRGLRWEMFSCIAEAHAMARAIAKVDDPDENAVLIELAPFGRATTLLGWMARAYARARGELDSFAWVTGTKDPKLHEGAGLPALDGALEASPARLVLKMVGLCVKDFFELETGTHVWRPYARQPELLRVRVLAASGTARQLLESPGDSALLPIVRSLRFDPPKAGGPASPLDLEDYVLGLHHAARVREPFEALLPLWLARLAREDA